MHSSTRKRHAHTLFCLVHGTHKKAWQVELARTYTLAAAIIIPVLTMALVVVLLLVTSPFAAKIVIYFAIATFLSILLFALDTLGRIRFTGLYLVCVYLFLSFGITWSVGVEFIPMVFCAWAIILAGMICGFSSALVPATLSTLFLIGYRIAELQGIIHPTYSLSAKPSDFMIVIFLSAIFYILAAISGMLHRLERARHTLWEAKEHFVTEKGLLTAKIKKQSQKLQLAESEKMHHLYRLAEAGEVSTILLHDLANTLTTLSLEVDDIERHKSGEAIGKVKQRIKQIHSTLNATRQQMKGNYYKEQPFNVAKEITYTVEYMRKLAAQSGIAIVWSKPREYHHFVCTGDKMLFRQLLSNVIKNAIESYSGVEQPQKTEVRINLRQQDDWLELTISDWGIGISPDLIDKVFEPFYTTKKGGTGMGMYVTKRFVEQNFKGTLQVDSKHGQTVFTIQLPILIPQV